MHDANGVPLHVGDRVIIEATVTELSGGGDDYCNVTVKTNVGRRPDKKPETISAINTGVLVKLPIGYCSSHLVPGEARQDAPRTV
jgi:hypothetical protein